MIRRSLSTKQREALWKAEAEKAEAAGKGVLPVCNICSQPITHGSAWEVSHDPVRPLWLGGSVIGAAHYRCNRTWNSTHDTPKFAKAERVRKRFMDFTRSRTPLPGGRDDDLKKTMHGDVVVRATGQPQYPRKQI